MHFSSSCSYVCVCTPRGGGLLEWDQASTLKSFAMDLKVFGGAQPLSHCRHAGGKGENDPVLSLADSTSPRIFCCHRLSSSTSSFSSSSSSVSTSAARASDQTQYCLRRAIWVCLNPMLASNGFASKSQRPVFNLQKGGPSFLGMCWQGCGWRWLPIHLR